MAQITGTPHVVVGDVDARCEETNVAVPDVCAECRQLDRWVERTIGWSNDKATRFRAILSAILREHDDALSSLCGTCALNPDYATDCGCTIQRFTMAGFSLAQDYVEVTDCVQLRRQQIEIPTACYIDCGPCPDTACSLMLPDPNAPTCWIEECGPICPPCETIELDPCTNPDHLDIMGRLIEARSRDGKWTGRGADIIEALEYLFPGGAPEIVSVSLGEVVVTPGRQLTFLEQGFFTQLLARIPRGFNVNIKLVTPCP